MMDLDFQSQFDHQVAQSQQWLRYLKVSDQANQASWNVYKIFEWFDGIHLNEIYRQPSLLRVDKTGPAKEQKTSFNSRISFCPDHIGYGM